MKVIIAGDFAPRERLAKQVEERRFEEIFPRNLVDIIKSADYSLANFESPIVEDGYNPITKCGPNLQCTPEAADAVKYAGFSAVTMANNHILDYGEEGLHKSIECCKKNNIDVAGVGNNLKEAEKVLYVERRGKKLAIINCCEHEFSIATDTTAGANPLNPIRQYYSIKEAKNNADYVLVIVHGGHEHYQLPSPRMQETYRFFIEAGADAVVNHHQHCYSGYEICNNKPIFYGIGNFAFDEGVHTEKKWQEGYFVEIDFSDTITFNIFPYLQYGEKPQIELLKTDAFTQKIESLNTIITDHKLIKESANEYYEKSQSTIKSFIQPIRNRWIMAAQNRGLFPSFITKKWMPFLSNVVLCEAHRDKLSYFLNKNLNKK